MPTESYLDKSDILKLERIIEAMIVNLMSEVGSQLKVEYFSTHRKSVYFPKLRLWLTEPDGNDLLMWWDPETNKGSREKYVYDSAYYFRGRVLFDYLRRRLGQLLAILKPNRQIKIMDYREDKNEYEGFVVEASCTMEVYKILRS